MQVRPKVFLTFALFCVIPLLLISVVSLLIHRKATEDLLRTELAHELLTTEQSFASVLQDEKRKITRLAESSVLRNYMRTLQQQFAGTQANLTNTDHIASTSSENNDVAELKKLLGSFVEGHNACALIAGFDSNRRPRFVAEPTAAGDFTIHTTNLLAYPLRAESGVTQAEPNQPVCVIFSTPSLGATLRCAAPVRASELTPVEGEVVTHLRLDSLVSVAAHPLEASLSRRGDASNQASVVVLSNDGEVVYHTNPALKHQSAQSSMPYFTSAAASMIAGQSGTQSFSQSNGDKWITAYEPLAPFSLSLAVTRNYSAASRDGDRYGWLGIGLALTIGLLAAAFLTAYYERKTQSIDRVAAGVGEIAKGKLDHRIELLSSDDLRPLADNVGLMTKQLREQIAREAEGKQFQSFVRLSAILTHDLKNAIEALSLIVSNMEHHFEKEEFRVDAMQSLTAATDKLRALVARLSNPVNTLSGEHKRPRPVDVVPILKRVIALTAEPARAKYEVRIKLPQSLHALVEAERIDKVAENLIINGLEAMSDRKGTLTIEAGETEAGKPFFSVSDTGEGMSERFIEERLFHPFATTKRKGVGLGLYTCREVVNANGGTIEVESREGAGTTFTVVLPSVANEAT